MKNLNVLKINIMHQGKKLEFWIPFLLTACVIFWILEPLKHTVSLLDYNINAGFISFLSSNNLFVFVFFLGEFIIFSKLPFKSDQQIYLILRLGKSSWVISHLLYVAVISAFYTLFSACVMFICIHPYLYFDFENWGKVIYTLCEFQENLSITSIVFDKRILTSFTPLTAMFYFLGISTIIGYMLGCIQFLANLLSRGVAGNIIASTILFLYLFSLFASGTFCLFVSPITWTNIQKLNVIKLYYPSVGYTIITSLSICFIFTLLCILVGGKKTKISLL